MQPLFLPLFLVYRLILQLNGLLTCVRKDKQICIQTYKHTLFGKQFQETGHTPGFKKGVTLFKIDRVKSCEVQGGSQEMVVMVVG